MVFYKMFFKVYELIGEELVFKGVISLEPDFSGEFIEGLDEVYALDTYFKVATLEEYTDYKLAVDLNDPTKFIDGDNTD